MSDLEKLEKRTEVLLEHLATNGKKIKQEHLKLGTVNAKRLEATIRIAQELIVLSDMMNELWEHPESEQIVGS